jgi:hypothetical protein
MHTPRSSSFGDRGGDCVRSSGVIDLTRIRRENPAFNYGFFRPNPLVVEHEAGKNAGHAVSLPVQGNAEQTKIARVACLLKRVARLPILR